MKATFCKTKKGNGFKIVINDVWLFVSKENLIEVVNDKAKSCHFNTIDDKDESCHYQAIEDEFENPFEDSSRDED